MPTGTVTFLFSDVEGSTQLVQELDAAGYRDLLERHQRLLRAAFAAHGGVELGTEGDSFFVVFGDAPSAVNAAVDAQRALQSAAWPPGHEIRVRMGIHSGEGILGGDDYVGVDVNRAARIASAARGSQVLVSEATRALADRNLPTGVGLRDLGEHRLKGLAMPERVFQVVIEGLASEFSPLRSEPSRAAHLPPRLTSFVGRRADLDEVQRLLVASRLVTLVGSGGTGKTSLATECAREVAGDYPDGAWFVALDAVSDPELVASAVVGALGLRDSGSRSARERLEENLSGRSLLLVLDNFEQVIEAAVLVAELMLAAPAVKLLVTSRAPLRVAGEQLYPVLPLAVPARIDQTESGHDQHPIALMSAPAIRLFVDRAQQVDPAFSLTAENADAVVEICARLDGLPLGIELAAARIKLLGAAGIRDRLVQHTDLPASPARDAPARQRTLRAAIAWSHDLLDAPGQALFARLSVFVGGFRLEEAEKVCGPATEIGSEVVDCLAALVDQSLVAARPSDGAVRYGMLETIREHAVERLAERDHHLEIHRRHALAYLGFAEAHGPALRTRRRGAIIALFDAESDNLLAAVRWSIEAHDAEIGLRLAAGLQNYWGLEGQIVERRAMAQAILDIPGADAPSRWRLRALEAAAALFFFSGDNERAGALNRAQLEVAVALDDPQAIADATFNLAWTEDWRGRETEANTSLDRLAKSYRELGDERSLARLDLLRGYVLLLTEDQDQARRTLEKAMARFRELDDVIHEIVTATMIGGSYLMQGGQKRAARPFVEALTVAREIGDVVLITGMLPTLAMALLELERPESAAVILGTFDAYSRQSGVQPPQGLEQFIAAYDAPGRARAALDPDTFDAATRRGREFTLDEAVGYALEIARPLL